MCHVDALLLHTKGRCRGLVMPGLDPGIHRKKDFNPRGWIAGSGNDSEWVSTNGHWYHSITLLARASSVGAKSRPSAFAVRRLMTSSNMEGCSTGRSLGLAPLRMRST